MSGVKKTPVRESKSNQSESIMDIQSPEPTEIDSLVGSMSNVKIDPSQEEHLREDTVGELPLGGLGAVKRINRESIEGSPFILKKRSNTQTTPIAFQAYRDAYIAEKAATPISKLQPTRTDPIFSTNSSAPLTVIVSGSDEHNTGDHQENSRRTKLLVGIDEGCLRRAPLQPYVHWIDGDSIAAPPISDLLRYVTSVPSQKPRSVISFVSICKVSMSSSIWIIWRRNVANQLVSSTMASLSSRPPLGNSIQILP